MSLTRMRGKCLKYTLAQNAISSLSIAIDNFKKIFYLPDDYTQTQLDEATKICIVFLENSIELMIKGILVSIDPLSIYRCPESKAVQDALMKATPTNKLEDILVSEKSFLTIRYEEAVSKYNEKYHNSDKMYKILLTLGTKRNAIVHFGIDETDSKSELIIFLINSFDVIYNYLYPQLIKLDDNGDFFTSDSFIVNTVHGKRPILDEDIFLYNNVVDFLDELMETSNEYACSRRAEDPRSKIYKFTKILRDVMTDSKLVRLLDYYNAQIHFQTCNYDSNDFSFEVIINSELFDTVISCYSTYFNATAFCGECGNIYFIVVHDTDKIYIYNQERQSKWPEPDEAEPDNIWLTDLSIGTCQEINLSKRNLLFAIECLIKQ